MNTKATKRVIITGGTGSVGRQLIKELTAHDYQLVVLSRRPDADHELPAGVQVAGWDAATAEGWGHLANGAAAIINLAGENLSGTRFFPTRWTEARRRRIVESRQRAGAAVVAAVAAAEEKPQLVLQVSAVGYYGPQAGQPMTEADPPGDDFLGQTCVAWEAATAPVEAMGVRRVVVRLGVVLSPEDGALQRLMLPFQLFAGGPMGSGRQYISWIHPTDVVQAMRFLIEHPEASGPFNLAAPEPVTNGQLGRALGQVLRRPYYMPVPAFALRLAFGEVASVVLDGQRVIPGRLQELGYTFTYPQVEPALRQLLA